MTQISQADIFIKTLTEMVEIERTRKLSQLFGRHKTHANWFGNWLKSEFDSVARRTGQSRHDLRADCAGYGSYVGHSRARVSIVARRPGIHE